MRRAQSGPEFIVLFGFLMLVFLLFLIALNNRYVEQRELNRELLYAGLADRLETEILIASQVAAGYRRQFSLPYTLDSEPYNVTLETSDTLVIYGESTTNEYLRFLSVPVTLVGGTTNTLFPPGNPTIIIENDPVLGVRIRKDCVLNNVPLVECV
ncbi:hypothetical protein D6789_00900 [Candidatus Woesearchaeota archaeon]|nr:MAG: hypothetical protein D6789_00900 [Candidatus Woesearchaeota archaeon]